MKCLGTDDHDLWDASYVLLASASMSVQIGQCLAHSDVGIRRGAARMLFELEADNLEADRKPAVLESLRLGINDDDAGVRLYSLLTIVQYKKANPDQFLPLATDGDELVRCAAVEALACRRPDGTRDVLFRLLAHDDSVRVRVRAAFALASIQLAATECGEQMDDPPAGKVDGKANALLQLR